MAFGIPGSEPSSGDNQFLGRIQYDARVGFWKIVKRVQGSDGGWMSEESEPFKNPTFLMDCGSLEVGYIKLTSPPAFLLVPYGQPLPPQPQEMMTDAQGKQRKAFLPGCRVKVASPKLFNDTDAYYFAVNSKAALGPMDELYQKFDAAPEAAKGLIPMVACAGTQTIEVTNKQGTSKFYAPTFSIVGWKERIPEFGERTVPIPGVKANGTHHAPPPAPPPAATDEPPQTVRAPEPAGMPDQW